MTAINWVSPLRPDATDIAEYTARVVAALETECEMRLIGNGEANELAAYRKGAEVFFNIGNDARFHDGILRACRSRSGIVVAHDLRIQNLIVAELHASHEDQWDRHYRDLMSRHYGKDGLVAAENFISGKLELTELSDEYPGIEIASEEALCVLTHNSALSSEIARRTGLVCATLPLPFVVPPRMPEANRERAGENVLDLLVFGYMGLNRGLDMLCDIIAQKPKVRLHIAGRIGPAELRRKVDEMKAAGHPIVDHGYVEEARLDQLIRDCDLVLNLRNPTMGEVSGSQLRIFANGGLSVVCNMGWYASLPEETVFKVRPEAILSELTDIIDRVSEDRAAFTSLRLAGYRHAREHHDLGCFAKAFHALMSELPEVLAHGRRFQLARHIGKMYATSGAAAIMSGEELWGTAERLLGEGPP